MKLDRRFFRAADGSRCGMEIELFEEGDEQVTWTRDGARRHVAYPTVPEAATAFLHGVASAAAEGYVEVLVADASSEVPDLKPGWQRRLDDALVAMAAGLPRRAELVALCSGPPHDAEPLFVWLDAGLVLAGGASPGDLRAALARLEAADASIEDRAYGDDPIYNPALPTDDLRRAIAFVRCGIAVALGDGPAALAAARAAYAHGQDPESLKLKLATQLQHAPQEREAVFHELYPHRHDPDFADLSAVDGFADYAAARASAPRPPHEWGPAREGATAREIAAAEEALDVVLPADYRDFLLRQGPAHMDVTKGSMTSGVDFIRPRDLAGQREDFRRFTGMDLTAYDEDGASVVGRIALADLVPIADCSIQSNSILLKPGHDGQDGLYFAWFHDSKSELYPMGSSFAEVVCHLENAARPGGSVARMFLELPRDGDGEDG